MPTDLRRLKRGERLSGIPGQTWNSFCDATEAVARAGLIGNRGQGVPGNPVLIDVKNNCGASRLVGEVFGVDTITIDKMDQVIATGINPTNAAHWPGVIAIAITPSANGGISKCVVSGLVRAVVDVTDIEIRTADLTTGVGTKLTSHLAGRARLLVPAASTGTQSAWVLLGGSRQIDWTGVAAAITAGSSGTVTIDGMTGVSVTAHLDKMHGSQNISSGKEVGVKWFDSDQKWRIMHAECES